MTEITPMSRTLFGEAWRRLDKLEEPHRKVLADIAEAKNILCETTDGHEPIAWCEACGVPFFEDDTYGTSQEDGIAVCLDGGPCYRGKERAG